MSIIFIYQYNKYKINVENVNRINEAFIKFLSIIDQSENDLIFLYNGKKINNKILSNQLNNIIISVFNIRMNKKNKECYIRCPTCHNLSNLNINKNNNKYNISLNNCINNHELNDLSIDEFTNYQNNIKIECDFCNNNKNLYNNNFYRCSCGKDICKLCLEKHNIKNHNIIEYNRRYDTCNKHGREYKSYCKDCKLNLCESCEREHSKHKIIIYKMIISNKIRIEEMKKDLNENFNRIKEYKEEINLLNEIFNNIMINYKNDLDDYIKMIKNILYYLDNLKNYETINNVINFKLEILNQDIDNYFMNDNIKKRMINLIDIFDRYINQIDIIYEINKEESELNIFGSKFVENNKNCLMMIDNKINKIKENIINDKKRKNLKILLFTDKTTKDMSYMFYWCKRLSSLSDISKWNTNNVIDMSFMFYGCEKLISLPDISKWNTNNVTDMSFMFYGCEKLISLPDISKWNTNNVTNISSIFNCCEKLISLPDISKWNTINVTNMSYIFNRCKQLSSLPDISKWKTNNVTDMSYMFYKCRKILSLPDISKWNTNNVIDNSYMLYKCGKLSKLPFISKKSVNKQ